MSAVVFFYLFQEQDLDGLAKASAGSVLRPTEPSFYNYIIAKSTQPVRYQWSGYYLGTLLPYLGNKQGIDLENTQYDMLRDKICNEQGTSMTFFDYPLREKNLLKLEGLNVSEAELGNYYETFNEQKDPDAGRCMRDGIRAFREALAVITPHKVMLVSLM